MKDLNACKAIVIFLALTTMLGCQALDANQIPASQKTAGLVAAAPNLEFGTVVVGASEVLTNTVTNTSASRVTMERAAIDQSDFSIIGQRLPLTLGPGQSASLSIAYRPRAHGSSSGTVMLASNLFSAPARFTVSGMGISAGQLAVNPASISFGSVPVGQTQQRSAALTNSGGSEVTISKATASGNGFSLSGLSLPLTLPSGQSTTVTVSFTPSSGGPTSGNVSIAANVSLVNPGGHKGKGHNSAQTLGSVSSVTTSVTVPVSGEGMSAGQLTATPASLNLGSVQLGASQTQSATLTNSGGSNVTLSQATVTGAGFSLSGLNLPLTLAAGQSTNFAVMFAPQSAGSVSGNIAIASDASNPNLAVSLSASGVTPGALTSSPSSLSFGTVMVGQSQTLSGTLTNSGGSSVTISQATIIGPGFSVSGMLMPLTLAAGQSKTFNVSFAPQASGSATGNLSLASNASNSTLGISLSGTALATAALTASPSSLGFGSVQVGNNQTLPETLSNASSSAVTITQANVSGSAFSLSGLSLPLTLGAGQSASFNVTFNPQSGGAATGSVAIASNASNPTLTVSFSGTGATPGVVSAASSTLSFGGVQLGSSATQSETLSNSGGSNVTISQATVTGTGFSISGLNLPLTLIPGQSFTFGASFAPSAGGNATGNISVISDASNSTLTISLSGSGTVPGALSVSPSTLNFGSVVVGQSKSMTASLSASSSSVTVSSASMSTSEFSLSGVSFPFTIAAGQSAPVTVVFTPQASGTAAASASFSSNASNSTLLQSLTGSGTPPPQHSVGLAWNDSTSAVVGYNVYRGTVAGGPYSKINSALNASTNYTDNSVQAGQTYFYVTTALDGSGLESKYSNQVQAVIPTP